MDIEVPVTDTPQLREAGRELLSLALMDARNHTLRVFAAWEEALAARDFVVPRMTELNPPLWELGHVGWFQEYWIARNMQRSRGPRCDPLGPRLASIEPAADRWYDSTQVAHDTRWTLDLPTLAATRQYLLDTLDTTLELLDALPADDAGRDDALYFYRLALFHEDMHGEAFTYMAQTLDFGARAFDALFPPRPRHAPLTPLVFPATRWSHGLPKTQGFVFDNEKWAHEVAVPEFEIDAQPVSWQQYAEFVEDGGYDEPRWWSKEGLAWLEGAGNGRRVPRHVEQLRGGVLARRFGRLLRVPPAQPAVHVSA
ncbi:MAG: DinB family protein, partial [Betaproteobacteria bacterium]